MGRLNKALQFGRSGCLLMLVCGCGSEVLDHRLDAYDGAPVTDCSQVTVQTIREQRVAAGLTDSTATWAYVLEEGEEAVFTRAWLSDHSVRSIDIQYFIFSMDNVGIIALDYLLRAADRGVQVRMLVDDIMLDVALEDVAALNAHPNIEIRIYNPTPGKYALQKVVNAARDFDGFNQRMHNKTFVVDGEVAITGGRNIADEYFDYDQTYNFRDRDVLLIGGGAEAIATSFEAFWDHPLAEAVMLEAEGDDLKALQARIGAYACDPDNFWPEIRALIDGIPDAIPHILASGRLHEVDDIQFVSDVPGKNDSGGFSGGGASTDALLALVRDAEKSVLIQSPYLVLTELGLGLFRDAVERGVEVTILTNSLCSTDNLEAFNGYQRIRTELLEAGIKVHEYRPDAAIRKRLVTAEKQKRAGYLPVFGLHAKSMVVDHRTVVIGTFNLDPRSANLNTECVAIMMSAPMAAQVEALMLEELTPENAWSTTIEWNPDVEAGSWKRFQCWLRGVVPTSIL